MRCFLLAIPGALILAGLHLGLASFLAERSEPGRGAAWIWADGVAEAAQPVAFWLARDFDLTLLDVSPGDVPTDPDAVRLTIMADESYRLWVNGVHVGSGTYSHGGPAHVYGIAPLLQPGPNRLLVEVESSRGSGGMLLSLRSGAAGSAHERVVLRSDDRWRVFRYADPAVLAGRAALDGGDAPKVWNAAPTGRFRLRGLEPRPTAPNCEGEPSTAATGIGFGPLDAVEPVRLRHLSNAQGWVALDEIQSATLPADQTVFDLGREVSGLLQLVFAAPAQSALLFFDGEHDDQTLRPQERRPDAVVAPFPGRFEWRDVTCRNFRYVTLVGMPTLRHIEVLSPRPADPSLASDPVEGVFGLSPAKAYTGAEEAVWDRLRADAETTGED